jgi:DNA repair protein RecO (recombination protein O)
MRSRERVYRTEAVILRRQNLGEADRLLTVYSKDRGKLRVVAKGVRRPRSRKAGHLEPFTRVQLMLARGRELDIITQADSIDPYSSICSDLMRLGQAAYVVELLDAFTIDRDENSALFRLLVNTLERLSVGADLEIVLRYYELRLLELSGYRPELFRCLGCGEEVRPEDQFFSPQAGGVICKRCGQDRTGVRHISLNALKVLRYYQRNTFAYVSSVSIRAKTHEELRALMEEYLSYILERKLNSPGFLRRVRGLIRDGSENAYVS